MNPSFVVDNSIVMSWCFQDEANDYADAVLNSLTDAAAIVPSIWPLEVLNVLLVAERQQRLQQKDSARFLALLSQLPIMVDQSRLEGRMGELLVLGRANQLSSYDASYLDLAMRQGVPIATLDQKLMAAARSVAVPLFAA
jgi:predicted nucleic acid-binding protein